MNWRGDCGGSPARGPARPPLAKAIMSFIDSANPGLAEELDFILNYDIKYRLGRDTETEME
jgi:hypothetical protein